MLSINIFKCLLLGLSLASCSYDKEINSLYERVSNLEDAVLSIQTAFNQGKIISSVTTIDDSASGYIVTFSNGTSITILQGKDGISPLIDIDSDGYWEISLNNGVSFSRVTDNSGNPVLAIGEKGNSGMSTMMRS